MFHKRFGSSTGKEEAGTLEEFLNAYDSWKTYKKPHIMFYFKEVKIRSRNDLKDEQLQKVLDLKEKIDQEKVRRQKQEGAIGITGHKGRLQGF